MMSPPQGLGSRVRDDLEPQSAAAFLTLSRLNDEGAKDRRAI